MHVSSFDHYQGRVSPVHRLDPRVKVVVTVLFIVSTVLLPDGAWTAFGCSWLLLLAATRLAHLSLGFVISRSLVALPFALAAATAVFSVPGMPVFSVKAGPWTLVATDAGVIRFASIMLRSWIAVQMAIVLTATTQVPDLMHALRHLRVPGVLVATVSFMYRYLFVLSDEALRLLRARDARSAMPVEGAVASPSVLWRARVTGNMAGQLFIRSYERSERVYDAMLARGYAGTLMTINPHTMTRLDWLWLAASAAALAIVQLLGRVQLPGPI